MGVITHFGNAVEWARNYSGPLFHALMGDAPYEMDFMGKDWDKSGVAFDPNTWEAFARVLYPGAFLFVFAGTINDDLISVAMREAGLRKFHKMMGWAYGSGFPKASRINYSKDSEWLSAFIDLPEIFSGHRYGLQAIKPAIETILVFQKPYEGKAIDNITETGAGALNIEGGRIGTSKEVPASPSKDKTPGGIWGDYKESGESGSGFDPNSGRWPSNLLLLDEEAARALDEQSGILNSGGSGKRSGEWNTSIYGNGEGIHYEEKTAPYYGGRGGASRFFFRVEEQIDEADPVYYCAKASRRERDEGLEGFDPKAIRESGNEWGKMSMWNGENGDEAWKKKNPNRPARNPHPTVKPLALTQYLATLLLPPPEYGPRRLFVPFAGVGSEEIGGHLAGWEEVEGVEITEEYIPINRARVEYWQNKPKVSRKPKGKKKEESIPVEISKPSQLEFI